MTARGRFITNEIARDKAINDLSDDTCRLAFTWLITFADREGRTYGDPAIILSMLFPRRRDISIERMTGYLSEWQAAGLVNWYEANGDLWLEFPSFDKHQKGLRKDREAPSIIPINPEQVQSNSGEAPAKIGLSLIKLKEELKVESQVEVESIAATATAFQCYEQNIGMLTPLISDAILDALETYPPEWIPLAIKEAVANNARNWKYAEAILKRWQVDGIGVDKRGKRNGKNAPGDQDPRRYITGEFAEFIES